MRTYEQAQNLRDKIEKIQLSELLAMNPTMREMYHIGEVMKMGYGTGHEDLDHDFDVIERLLKGKKHRIQKAKSSSCANQELRNFLQVLSDWYNNVNAVGPNAGALLFDDDYTFKEHLDKIMKHV